MEVGAPASGPWRRRLGWGLVAPLALALVGLAVVVVAVPVVQSGTSVGPLLPLVLLLVYFGLPTLPAVIVLGLALVGVLVLPSRGAARGLVRGATAGLLAVALAYGAWFLVFAERYDRNLDLERRTRALVSLGAEEPVEPWLIERTLRARWPRGTERDELVAGLVAAGFGIDPLSQLEQGDRLVVATILHDPATRGLGRRSFLIRFELDVGGALQRIEASDDIAAF